MGTLLTDERESTNKRENEKTKRMIKKKKKVREIIDNGSIMARLLRVTGTV